MDCVSPILDFLSGRSRDLFSLFFGHIVSLEKNVYLLKRETGELRCIGDDVKREVDAAERQGLTCTNQVRWWLVSVDALGREAAAVDIEFQRLFRCFGDCPLNVASRYSLGKRAAEKLVEVRDLKGKAVFSRIADGQVVGQIEEMHITCPVGMDPMLRRLHEHVGGYEVDITGIHGMGGVGKTTLLKKLNNDLLCSEHGFDIVIFLEVTKDLNLEMVQRTLASRLGLRWQENQDPRELSSCILRYLGTKKFVILLDDVWEPLDLPSIGIPLPSGQNRRKIILTTRRQEVCFQMDAQELVKVECLPWPEAWALFALKARKDFANSPPEMQTYAKAIARKCGGLPLALTTMGRAMASKQTVKEWVHGFITMVNEPWKLPGMKEQVLLPLKSSYDNLATDELRQCFLYCSLYSESFSIGTERLIDCWLCEGFLGGIGYLLSPSDRGHHFIGLLKAASLLETAEEDDDDITMHPMMRNLALWIASGRAYPWLVQARVLLRSAPEVESWREAERISLMENELDMLPEAPDCPHLLTLMLCYNNNLGRLAGGFFLTMRSLKVLDLSFTSLQELPPSIGELLELRHLNLWMTNLVSLPRELERLEKLNHLEVGFTSTLRFIPKGVITRLAPSLQLLGMFNTQIDWQVGTSSADGVCLEELEGTRQLSRLGISIQNAPALQGLCGSQHLASSTTCLHVHGCEGMASLLLPSAIGRSLKDLRILRISNSSDLQEVVLGLFDNEDELCFFRNLRYLDIRNLAKARIVCRGLLPQHALGRLRELRISGCPAIEQLIEGATAAFAGVQELYLQDLPMLTSICSDIALIFHSLHFLQVNRCPRLSKLPLGLPSDCYNLISIKGERAWWDNLEWQGDFIKSSFQPIFQEMK